MDIINKIVAKVNTGKQYEKQLLPTIQKHLELDTLKNTTGYCHYDYTGKRDNKRYWIELKQRNIKYKQYPTIFINTCKLETFRRGLSRGNRCYIFYLLTDDLYYLELTKENIDKYHSRKIRERQDETDNYIPTVTDIDMEDLKLVH